jgi:hypothetical protein
LRQAAKRCGTHLCGHPIALAQNPHVGVEAGNRHPEPIIRLGHRDRPPHDQRHIRRIASGADAQQRGAGQTSRRVVREPGVADQHLDPRVEPDRGSLLERHGRHITRRQAAGAAQRDHQVRQIGG